MEDELPTDREDTVAEGDTRAERPQGTRAPKKRLERGAPIGRYVTLGILGEGGMGIVYEAYDPELDRKVAIKLLQIRNDNQVWLLREAQALARLAHPNVIAVHDVGTVGDRVFVAMELVEGKTLREHLRDDKPAWPEVLAILRDAGAGLAAAHDAGLVHRDFKPENVILGKDGRVRVMDFGLARLQVDTPQELRDPTPLPHRAETEARRRLHEQLTAVGTVIGTPPYMAPELHAGTPADPRTDQFAFGVTLYESLFGSRPYTFDQLLPPVATPAKPLEPPRVRGLPASVQRAALRALSLDSGSRFPTMHALLAEMAVDRRSRTLALSAAGATLAAATTIGILAAVVSHGEARAPTAEPTCEAGADRLTGVWDAGVKAKVDERFRATKRTHAAATIERVAAELDRYADEWSKARVEVCSATRIRHDRSEAAFDLGMRCLDERLEGVRALTALFASQADGPLVDKAALAVLRLPRAGACLTVMPGAVPLPDAPDARAKIDELRREAAALRAYRDSGKQAAGADKAVALLARAKALGFAPVQAEIGYLLGELLSGASKATDAEAALRDAVVMAARAKDDRLTAQIWILLVRVVGFQRAAFEEGLALRPVAEVAIERAEGGEAMTGDLDFYIGAVDLQKGAYDQAEAAFTAALAQRTKALGEDHPDVADVYNNLGATLLRKGDLHGAEVKLARAIAIREKALGPSSPDVALPLGNLGSVLQMEKRYDEAAVDLERSEKILEDVLGPDHVNVGLTVNNLGELAVARGDCDKAVGYYTRALAVFEKQGPTHPYVAYALVGRAKCKGDVADAERAVAILAAQKGDPSQLAEAELVLAQALWGAGDHARAKEHAAAAQKGYTAAGAAAAEPLAEVTAWLAAHP